MKIIFTGGGTGGHIFPIIAIVREMRKKRPDFRFYYIGPKNESTVFLLSQEGIIVKTILAGKIRRYWQGKAILENLLDIFIKIPIGFLQSSFYIFFLFPDLVFSKGGYGAFSISLMGWVFLTPVILHESDATPGLANRIMSKFALEIFSSFPIKKAGGFPSGKIICVGNPIRQGILKGEEKEAEEIFKLDNEKPVILILGGSQGSQRINEVILNILPRLLENFQIIHQTGSENFNQVKREAEIMIQGPNKKNYHPFPFLEENRIKHAYKVAGLIITRAGAGSIFEIAACEKPSILIPLPESAQNHQVKNAYAYQKTGACIVIEEKNLAGHFLLERLKYLFSDPNELKDMSAAAKFFSRPRAAEIIAQYILEYLIY